MKNMNRVSDGTIEVVRYDPNGMSNILQKDITDLMHRIVQKTGNKTLAEMGYLHCNSVIYDNGHLDVQVYFARELALEERRVSKVQNKKDLIPIEDFKIFENYLFIGDPSDSITVEKMEIPKYRIETSEVSHTDIVSIKDKNDKIVEENVVVLHCNLAVMMAAIQNVNMEDPNFTVAFDTIGKTGKNKYYTFINMGTNRYPVSVTVTMSDQTNNDEYIGFDPDQAIPYLKRMIELKQRITQNQKNLEQKVSSKAKKKKKKENDKKYSGFGKYC